MAYADYGYYVGSYLLGREPAVPEDEFPFWEKQARTEIDLQTFNRLKGAEEVPEEAKDCVCALAELLYKADRLDSENLAEGVAGALTSYSNDGQSGSFDVSQSVYTVDGRKKETERIIRKYLLGTGLMFKGVYEHDEP